MILHITIYGFNLEGSFNAAAYFYYWGTISIPLFFMVNGYFLLNKASINYGYILDKIKNIVLVASSWNILYWLATLKFEDNIIKKILSSLLQRGYFIQFWFLGSIIIIYLTLPLLKKCISSYRVHFWLTVFLLILGGMVQLSNYSTSYTPIQSLIPQTFRLWTWYAYYLLGGLLGRVEIKNIYLNYKTKVTTILTSFFILVLPFFEFYNSKNIFHNQYAEYYYDSVLIKILVVLLFISFIRLDLPERMITMIKSLSESIMGIFIIHLHVIKLLRNYVDFSNVFVNLAMIPIVFLVSFFITKVLIKYLPKTSFLFRI